MLPGLSLLAATQPFSFIRAAFDEPANGDPRLESHFLMQREKDKDVFAICWTDFLAKYGHPIFAHSTFTECLLWHISAIKELLIQREWLAHTKNYNSCRTSARPAQRSSGEENNDCFGVPWGVRDSFTVAAVPESPGSPH